MPGENLQKLSGGELKQLRLIVRQVYAREAGLTEQQAKDSWTNRECDKLIDSLLPGTVEKLKEMGESRGFLSKKKFFLPSKILNQSGSPFQVEDTD